MKNLITYLSKKSLSLGNGSGMTRKWFGNDSGMTRFSLASLICVLMLTIGSGNVWAGNEVYKTALFGSSYNSVGVSSYSNSWYSTNDGFQVDITNANNNNNGWSYIKMGSKSAASVGKITTYAAIDKKVTQVRLTIDAITAGNITSITLYKSTNGSTWTSVGTFAKSTGAKDVAIAAGDQATNLYYKIEFVCTSGSSNGLITISRVDYYIDGVTTTSVTLNKNTGSTNGSAEFSLGESSYNSFTAAVPASCKICTGYWTATSGGNKVLNPDGSFAADNVTGWITSGKWSKDANSATLYAQWADEIYSVTLKDNNATLTQASCGASVTLPSRAGCSGYTFAGWTKTWVTAQTSWTTTAPTIIPAGSYTPSANENLYPVYTKTEGGGGTTSKTLYYEPFTGSANASAVQSTNVAATTDMFTDASATVWSHYTFNAGSTTSYATNLDGDQMSNGTKILKQTNNTTVTMMEVTGIKITNATNMSLSLYNRRTYTSATLSISYKIDNGSYTAVGGTISYNSTNDKWKLCEGLTISGTGNSLSLKIELVVSGTTNRTMLLDDIKVTGTVPNSTTSYISVPDCCTKYDVTLASSGTISGAGTFSASPASACEGNTVTLSTDICAGYTVGDWTVTKAGGGTVTVTSNQFTMPAENVTVSLATTAKVDHFIDRMHNTTNYTGAGYAVSGCNKTVPTISDKSKGSECEGEHYKFVGWVDEDHIDSDGTLLSGYSIVSGGTTSWNATGTNYYAIWAEEVTP